MKQFLSFKSSFYFLRNVVFALFCFLLGFLLGVGMLKASAATTINLTNLYDTFKERDFMYHINDSVKVNLKEQLKELSNTLKESNMNYIIYFSRINLSDNCSLASTTCYFDVHILEYSTNQTTLNVSEWSSSMFDNRFSTKNLVSSIYLIASGSYSATDYTTKFWNDINNYIKENNHLPTSNFSNNAWRANAGTGNATEYSASRGAYYNGLILYDTNMEVKYNIQDYDSFTLNENIYKANSKVPIYSQLSAYGKEKYTENYRVNTKDVDRIEYTFNLENNSNVIHEFNFSTTWYSSMARLDLFSPPHLEYTQNNVSYKLPLDANRQATLDEVVYYDTQINPFMDIEKLKFVVDFSNVNAFSESSIFIHFDSSLNYERKVIYTSDVESNLQHYIEVDFSNKYGIYLIPKVLQNEVNREIYSNIMYQGKHLKIDVFDSVDTTVAPTFTKYDDNNVGGIWGNFNYLFRFNNQNQMLFFTNVNYLEDSEITRIKYDTRYFIHSICDSKYNCKEIQNPNTGEEINPMPPVDEEKWDLDKIFEVVDDFLDDVRSTRKYFNQCFDAFWNEMPGFLQTVLIFIYIMFNVIVLIRIGGWNND